MTFDLMMTAWLAVVSLGVVLGGAWIYRTLSVQQAQIEFGLQAEQIIRRAHGLPWLRGVTALGVLAVAVMTAVALNVSEQSESGPVTAGRPSTPAVPMRVGDPRAPDSGVAEEPEPADEVAAPPDVAEDSGAPAEEQQSAVNEPASGAERPSAPSDSVAGTTPPDEPSDGSQRHTAPDADTSATTSTTSTTTTSTPEAPEDSDDTALCLLAALARLSVELCLA